MHPLPVPRCEFQPPALITYCRPRPAHPREHKWLKLAAATECRVCSCSSEEHIAPWSYACEKVTATRPYTYHSVGVVMY